MKKMTKNIILKTTGNLPGPFGYVARYFAKKYFDRGQLDFYFKPEDLNLDYYNRVKDLGEHELEHQIGRFTNFKAILEKCADLEGDLVEFGCWQGYSLLWTGYFLERNAIYTKKLVGLDGFTGLPYEDGVFNKGDFKNTSLKLCANNTRGNPRLNHFIRRNIHIGKFLYNQKKEIRSFLGNLDISKLCFIHIDCDVSQSAIEIFELLRDENLIADSAFILFDDYYCESDLAQTVDGIFKSMANQWLITPHSRTKLTQNFFLEKRLRL